MEHEQSYLFVSPNGNGKHGNSLGSAYEHPLPEKEEDLDLRWLLSVLRRRIPVIFGVTIAVTSAVGWWTFHQEPRYEAKFQLLVEPVATPNQLNQLSEVPGIGNSSFQNSSLDYETQIEVLRSPEVLEPFIKQLALKYPEVTYDSLIAENKLTIRRLNGTKILEVYYQDTDPQKIQFLLFELAKIYLRYSFQERQRDLSQGIKFVENQLPELQQRVDKLAEQLQNFRQQYALLEPEAQAKQLSERVQTLQQQQLDTRVQLNNTLTLYSKLQEQLGLQPNQAITATYLSEAPRYQQLLNQLQKVEISLALESARFLDGSPAIEALQEQRQNLLPLLRQEAQKVLGGNLSESVINSDSLTSPSDLRLELTQQFVDATNRIRVLEVQQSALAQAASLLNQQVGKMPFIARKYDDLQRELKVATDSLNRFLAARETLQIDAAQKTLPWKLLSKPKVPEVPIFPNPVKNLILGTAAGLFLGLGAALLTEKLDNVFRSPEELKQSTRLPLLGVIPFDKALKQSQPKTELETIEFTNGKLSSNKATTPANGRKYQWYFASPFLEAFRSLHTNIRFLGSDTPINSLVVTSPGPSDGKSTVAMHLAEAAAAMEQRVLLVDADLRRPQVHRLLGLPNTQGLSNVIATGLKLKDAIQRVPSSNNLYVLTAGQPSPDPTRLLYSKRMQLLMEQLQSVFDLVIYDTPPSLGFADSKILAPYTNGVVLVVRLNKTDRHLLRQTTDELKSSRVTLLGVIANSFKNQNYSSYNYNYYRSYYDQESEVQKAKRLLQKRL
ncbi:polysaccharide biosynthesis tyrosine autokinase [Lyngbya aestuarii]|uniref:polysaccharide biosynthesis tyrosine autokinase n=1 Tax=Lyngbya aestuarii TaxID=118322 RepID=UPI00403E111B